MTLLNLILDWLYALILLGVFVWIAYRLDEIRRLLIELRHPFLADDEAFLDFLLERGQKTRPTKKQFIKAAKKVQKLDNSRFEELGVRDGQTATAFVNEVDTSTWTRVGPPKVNKSKISKLTKKGKS